MKESSFPAGIIEKVKGVGLVLKGNDIDTDRIIPARFLKCVNFDALGEQVFADDRNELKGSHPFDKLSNKDASILIVNDNFGCGSSREHAPQALMRWGIRGIIGQSFAEIFFGNCLALGIPCTTTSEENIKEIQDIVNQNQQCHCEIDLKYKKFIGGLKSWPIEIDNGPLEMLLTGQWDATSQLISQKIALKKIIKTLPYLNGFEAK